MLELEELVGQNMPPGSNAPVVEALSLMVMASGEQIGEKSKFALFRGIMNLEPRIATSCGNRSCSQ